VNNLDVIAGIYGSNAIGGVGAFLASPASCDGLTLAACACLHL
jgi:hypothetical protein